MSDYQEQIIREFSIFRLPKTVSGGSTVPMFETDPKLRRIMGHLVSDDLRVGHDAWARYFLFSLYARDNSYLPELQPPNPGINRLDFMIEHWIWQAPIPNEPVLVIHRHLINQRHVIAIAKFLRDVDQQARILLTAYLQRSYWYAAQKIVSQNNSPDREECFQVALERVSDPAKLLRRFEFNRNHIQIRTYAEEKLRGIIRDAVIKVDAAQRTQASSQYGLLRSLSKTELKSVLSLLGENQTPIASLTLMLDVFNEIYQHQQTGQKRLPAPTSDEFALMSDRYNQRAKSLDLPHAATVQDVEAMLLKIEQRVRQYHTPASYQKRLQESLENDETGSPNRGSDPEESERRTDRILQMRGLLQQALPLTDAATLTPIQKAMLLWWGLDLTQADILRCLGDALGIEQQYQLSRKLKKLKVDILLEFTKTLNKRFPELLQNRSSKDKKELEPITKAATELLQHFCQRYFEAVLEELVQTLSSGDRQLLRLRHGLGFSDAEAAEYLKQEVTVVQEHCAALEMNLMRSLQHWTEQTLEICLDDCPSAARKLQNGVRDWLTHHIMNYL